MTRTANSKTTRARNPRGQGAKLRVDLLNAAAELMSRHGSIDKVSVRAVAAEVGVSPTAVYRHFDSHTDLLWAAVNHCFSEFSATMLEAQASTSDVYDKLRRSGDAYVRFATEQTGKYRVMFANRVELPATEEPVGMAAFDDLVDLVAAILADRGDGREPRFVAAQVWTWIHGIVDLLGSHPDDDMWPSTDELLDDLLVRLELDRP